jgi:hypothetical protein
MNASISVVCYKSKTLSNGENPLMIQVSKNGKRKIFNIHGINKQAKFATIKKYGGVDELKGKETIGKIRLGKFMPDFEY